MDQLTSTVPGIKPQLTGRLTNTPIVGAQVFADHSSSPHFLHTHLLENLTLEETLKAKVGFERLSATFGVTVHHYRADNGRFGDVGFKQACAAGHQTIDYCAANSHFQNGIAESNIGHLQESTRTILLNAIHYWPGMVLIEL